jgi:hypothetical protein
MLTLLQRQPDQPRRIFGHGRATADLMDANDPIRSDQLQHDPPLHPELPATTTGRSHSTPTFWTVSTDIGPEGAFHTMLTSNGAIPGIDRGWPPRMDAPAQWEQVSAVSGNAEVIQ